MRGVVVEGRFSPMSPPEALSLTPPLSPGVQALDDECLDHLKAERSLREVQFEMCHHFTYEGLSRLLVRHAPILQRLEVQKCLNICDAEGRLLQQLACRPGAGTVDVVYSK